MDKIQEMKDYDERLAHIANQKIKIDLDEGVKVNYNNFKDVLYPVDMGKIKQE